MNLYYRVFLFIAVAALVGCALLLVPFILNKIRPDEEKNSQYECGVEPFGGARTKFDIHFYLVAMLFIVFDLELALLLPWTMVAKKFGFFGLISMLSFLFLVTIGFVYEWRKKVMDW